MTSLPVIIYLLVIARVNQRVCFQYPTIYLQQFTFKLLIISDEQYFPTQHNTFILKHKRIDITP